MTEELWNDHACMTCNNSTRMNEDENGNPEYVICRLNGKEMPLDGICIEYE